MTLIWPCVLFVLFVDNFLGRGRGESDAGKRASYETPVSIASRTKSAVRATPSLDLIWVQVLAMVL